MFHDDLQSSSNFSTGIFGGLLFKISWNIDKLEVGDGVSCEVDDDVGCEVGDNDVDDVDDGVGCEVGNDVDDGVGCEVGNDVDDGVGCEVGDEVGGLYVFIGKTEDNTSTGYFVASGSSFNFFTGIICNPFSFDLTYSISSSNVKLIESTFVKVFFTSSRNFWLFSGHFETDPEFYGGSLAWREQLHLLNQPCVSWVSAPNLDKVMRDIS